MQIELTKGFKVSRVTGGNLASLPSLDSHEMFALQGKLFVFGGYQTDPIYGPTNNILKIDVDRKSYVTIKVDPKTAPLPRMNFAACVYSPTSFLVLGGRGPKGPLSDLLKFDVSSETWTTIRLKLFSKGLKGHQITYHEEMDAVILFGGIHDTSDENRKLFIIKLQQQNTLSGSEESCDVKEIHEQEIAKPILPSHLKKIARQFTRSFSKVSEHSRNRNKDYKNGRHRKFFLKSPLEVNFYEREFKLTDEKLKSQYREETKEVLHIKGMLDILGVYNSKQEYLKILSEDGPREYTETFLMNEDGTEQSKSNIAQEYLKEIARPLPREGFAMVFMKKRLVIVGGMRYTLAFNEISFILEENLDLQPSGTSCVKNQVFLPLAD